MGLEERLQGRLEGGKELAPSTWRWFKEELSEQFLLRSLCQPRQVVPVEKPPPNYDPVRRIRFEEKGKMIANLGLSDIIAQYGLSSASCSAAASSSTTPAASANSYQDNVEILIGAHAVFYVE